MTIKVDITGANGKVSTEIEIKAEVGILEQLGLIWDKAIAAYAEVAKDEAVYPEDPEDQETVSKQADSHGVFWKYGKGE